MVKINTYTVTQVNKYIKKLMDNDFILTNIMVKGEISNFKKHSSGHLYFSLKDEGANIRCVMFKGQTLGLKFCPEDGMKVVISGYISTYERDGQYQLYCDFMQVDGLGDLYVQYEKLKEKLEKEGLFNDSEKRKLPIMPGCVGVITSSTGAVIRDILNVSLRRFPKANIRLFPSPVQGEGAYKEIVRQIKVINEKKLADVIIIARGGGSMEDLWNFNSEELAYAIYESKVPIVSAVGHETDFTICDFVSDLRAPTPSAAAELVFPIAEELYYKLLNFKKRLKFSMLAGFEKRKRQVKFLSESYYLKRHIEIINRKKMSLDMLEKEMTEKLNKCIEAKKWKYAMAVNKLDALSPLKVLTRGYSVAKRNGRVICSKEDININDTFNLRLSDGEILARREE